MEKTPEITDVCVIGSGAGGGVIAKELGEKGMKVVLLEAGRRFEPLQDYTAPASPDFETHSAEDHTQFIVPELQKVSFTNTNTYRPVEAHGVGGSTLRYLAYALRMLPSAFKIYSLDGVGTDWPISYEDLAPYYRKVELELGVSGIAGDPWSPPIEPYLNPPFQYSYSNKILKRGFDKLGLNLWPCPMARLSKPFEGRPKCVQCGKCEDGCLTKAKSSTDVTYIVKAEATGRVIVLPNSIATHIRTNSEGKPTGVVYFDRNGIEHEQKARIIVISGGAVQSPRLLLNSTSTKHPQGLGNSSGLIGKFFQQHHGADTVAIFPDRIDSYRGFNGGAISKDFAETSPRHSFARGWIFELYSGPRYPIETALSTNRWGASLKDYMSTVFGHTAALSAVAEQIPYESNSVLLDPVIKDALGMPIPRITIQPSNNDNLMVSEIKKKMVEIMEAAGATQITFEKSWYGSSAHNYGTCRMGNDPQKSVVNSFCQSHEIPNLFVVDSSCFVTNGVANPSLTIHAIAVRASDYIYEETRKMNL